MTLSVLVTGAHGFIGRYVSLVCAMAGHKVRGLGHGSWAQKDWSRFGLNDWQDSDISFNSMNFFAGKPDLIIHCAGSSSVGFSLLNPAQDFDRTVETTRNILEYVRLRSPGTRVVIPSSASVYCNAQTLPINVGSPIQPISPYGFHKRMAEELCISYAENFGLSVAIIRLFSIYGVGLQKQLLWDACSKLSCGEAIFGGSGQELRDWLHVEDAARLLLSAGEAELSAPLFVNGATGVGTSTQQIIESIAEFLDVSGDIKFSGASRLGDPRHLIGDIAEAKTLNWQPKRSLMIELAGYVNWFKAGVF